MTASDFRYDHETGESERLHRAARSVIPGGVSHNVRYASPYPIAVARAEGATLEDVDGNEYVDFWNNHGAGILGHSHPDVVDAVREQVADGIHYGAVNEPTVELARTIPRFVPSAERVRFCCSGTEATMYAVRLARASTGRDRILKVEGGWHGGNSDLAHSVHPPFDAPTTAGLPSGIAGSVHPFRMNDREAVADLLERYRGEVAGVIIDPRRGGIPPEDGFLSFLADEREDRGFRLIFDEVVTGFRVSPGSYQARAGITPDLTTLGKILGGGFPVGAVCGRADLFENARPDRPVPADERVIAGGGTFSTHPTTARAGLATLAVLRDEPIHERTESRAERLCEELQGVFDAEAVDAEVLRVSSLVRFAFSPRRELRSPGDLVTATDRDAAVRFHQGLIERGYYFNPGSMGNVSSRITDEHVRGLAAAAGDVIEEMRDEGCLSAA